MKTPSYLLLAALALWGQTSGQWLSALLLGACILLPRLTGLQLTLEDRALTRAADLTSLFTLAAFAYFVTTTRMPQALYAGTGWLPVTTLPLLLAALFNRGSIRNRHIFYSLRRARGPMPQRPVPVPALYLLGCMVSAATVARQPTFFFPAAVGLLAVWITLNLPDRRPRRLVAFTILLVLATGLGYMGARGLQAAHQWAQAWFVDKLNPADDDPYRSQTRIGDLGRVELSDGIRWRVSLPRGSSIPALLRDGVYTYFDGQSWYTRLDSFQPVAPLGSTPAAPIRITGSSDARRVLLPTPQLAVQVGDAGGIVERNPYGVFRLNDMQPWIDVLIDSSPLALIRDTTRPAGVELQLRPELAKLFERIPEIHALIDRPADERVQGVVAFLADHFSYTLDLGDDPAHPRDLERFLLSDRAGHCEYFATATVLMLRYLDVPARYVTGYSVQEYSPLEKRFIVRGRHAHAWTEAWVGGRWQELDTTPGNWLTTDEQEAAWWRPARDFFSWLWLHFTEWRLNEHPGQTRLWLLPLLALLMAALFWQLRHRLNRRRAQDVRTSGLSADALAQALARLEADFGQRGFPRHPGETPRHWLQRLTHEAGPHISAHELACAGTTVDSFYRQRFARPTTTPEDKIHA